MIGHQGLDKSVRLAAIRGQVAPPAFTDYWAPMNGQVCASCRPPAASCTSNIYRLLGYLLKLFDSKSFMVHGLTKRAGGSRNVEGCWGFPYLKKEKLPKFNFIFFDRYGIHIQDFVDFIYAMFMIVRSSSSEHLIKGEVLNISK